MAYNANFRRTLKEETTADITHFVWDWANDSYLMKLPRNGSPMTIYTTDGRRFGTLVSQSRGSSNGYYHFDGQLSTRELTDPTESTIDQYLYSAFGRELHTPGGSLESMQFCGSIGYFADTFFRDLYYVRNRTFDAVDGRWNSRDPFIQHMVHLHPYLYGDNNPLQTFDPLGLLSVSFHHLNRRHRIPCNPGIVYRLNFALSADAECDGYVVQKVIVFCRRAGCFRHRHCRVPIATKCPPGTDPFGTHFYSKDRDSVYYEANFVAKGTPAGTVVFPDVISSGPYGPHVGQCGWYRQVGAMRFFCAEGVTGQLSRLWLDGRLRSFGVRCPTFGGLFVKPDGNPPTWWDRFEATEPEAKRYFDLRWKCCPPDGTSC
jgi:RHS repeat-associated protein